MVILYETAGHFIAGKASFRSLTSKNTRGTIQLTEKLLLFKSEIDKISYQIKISDIKSFSLKKRLTLDTIEMSITPNLHFVLYPLIKTGKYYESAKEYTEDLYRVIVRTIIKEKHPILFEARSYFWAGTPMDPNAKANRQEGLVFLTEEVVNFKPLTNNYLLQVNVADIIKIGQNTEKSTAFVKIKTVNQDIYSFTILKKRRRSYSKDKEKTARFYDFFNQARSYKESEKVKRESAEKERLDQIRSMLAVSNRIKLEMMRVALDMEKKPFTEKIFKWAKKFDFVIDGKYLIVKREKIPDFLDNLDKDYFSKNKIECSFCGREVEKSAVICPYCGNAMKE